MDSIDLRLLKELTKNARINIKDLADMVFLSSPAISARIEKLVNEKTIKGFHADIDFEKLGADCVALVNYTAQRTLPENFSDFINEHPNIVECYAVAGEYTHVMKVAFRTAKQLYKFVETLNKYGKTEVNIIMDKIKTSCDVEVDKIV